MKKNTREAVIRWIKGAATESHHPYDLNRFYNIVNECIIASDVVDSEELSKIIRGNLNWNEKKTQDFSEEAVSSISKIVGFIEFLKSEKQINIYNLLN